MVNTTSIGDLPKVIGSAQYVFVCSSSFEERCLKLPSVVSSSGNCVEGIVLRNEENLGHVGQNAIAICQLLQGKGRFVSVFGSDPMRTAESLFSALSVLLDPNLFLVIDISAMMREPLLMLLAILKQLGITEDQVLWVYVPANYNPTNERPVLSFGSVDVRSVLGFAGDYSPNDPRHLILLAGFEVERARAVIQATDPSSISVGVGDRKYSTSVTNAGFDAEFADGLLKSYPRNAVAFKIFPNDALLTADAVVAQMESLPTHKPLVCAMNTKISTCGAALAAWRVAKAELVYCQPALYNFSDYSVPGEEVYYFRLPLALTQAQPFQS